MFMNIILDNSKNNKGLEILRSLKRHEKFEPLKFYNPRIYSIYIVRELSPRRV